MIDGTNAGGTSDGFLIQADDVNLSGFTIGNFHWSGGYGIELNGDRATITEMAIGSDLTGQIRQPIAYGIWSTGNDVVIGGSNPQDRNLITGADNGQITLSPSVNVLIDGNLIGTNVDATSLLVEWNTGIEAWSGSNVQIGTMDAGNVIGAWWGIETGAADVTIENNLIGTNATHDADLGGWQGIGSWSNAVIRANTIGNWEEGIEVSRPGSRIEGNWIGTDPTRSVDLGMLTYGIAVGGAAIDTTIGGTDMSHSNVITNNGTTGVELGPASNTTTIIGNSIYSNGGLGIDLGRDGVTTNDPGDFDLGANDLLNHPDIVEAIDVGGSVTVDFLLDVPAGQYRIEAFVNPSGADPSGFGEGETLVAATTVFHGGAGNESFQLSYSGAIGDIVTMTATNETSGPNSGFTSEFSVSHLVN